MGPKFDCRPTSLRRNPCLFEIRLGFISAFLTFYTSDIGFMVRGGSQRWCKVWVSSERSGFLKISLRFLKFFDCFNFRWCFQVVRRNSGNHHQKFKRPKWDEISTCSRKTRISLMIQTTSVTLLAPWNHRSINTKKSEAFENLHLRRN